MKNDDSVQLKSDVLHYSLMVASSFIIPSIWNVLRTKIFQKYDASLKRSIICVQIVRKLFFRFDSSQILQLEFSGNNRCLFQNMGNSLFYEIWRIPTVLAFCKAVKTWLFPQVLTGPECQLTLIYCYVVSLLWYLSCCYYGCSFLLCLYLYLEIL